MEEKKKIKIKDTHLENRTPSWTDFEVTERVVRSAIGDRDAKMLPKTKPTLHANKWLLTTLNPRTT